MRAYFQPPLPLPSLNYETDSSSFVTPTPTLELGDVVPIVLMVMNQDAAELIWAEQNQVPLALVMRSASDTSKTVIRPVGRDTVPH
jgi:hypothetical protein